MPGHSRTRFVGQISLVTQFVGGQHRTTTSKQQHSVASRPVVGFFQVTQQATVVLPLGKKVPETCVQLVATAKPHGSSTCGGGKNTMAPSGPVHETWVSLGQRICGWHWSVIRGQPATITLKQQHFRRAGV